MHRFYLSPPLCQGPQLVLTGREAHHARHVLRLRRGEKVIVLDGAGSEFLCEAEEPAPEIVRLSVVQKSFFQPLPYRLTLLQAIPKGKIIESIIQKATELGAVRIVPLLAERVATQMDDKSAAAKLEKWRLTTVEAIKQCGSAWLPQVETPLTPKEFLIRGEQFELPLIASLQNDGHHPREYFHTFYAERRRLPRSVCVWIGPEGDFTPAELDAIKSAGALPITLGRPVLRSETAAVYCLSVLNYELQSGYV